MLLNKDSCWLRALTMSNDHNHLPIARIDDQTSGENFSRGKTTLLRAGPDNSRWRVVTLCPTIASAESPYMGAQASSEFGSPEQAIAPPPVKEKTETVVSYTEEEPGPPPTAPPSPPVSTDRSRSPAMMEMTQAGAKHQKVMPVCPTRAYLCTRHALPRRLRSNVDPC